jgi:hypothetical protein
MTICRGLVIAHSDLTWVLCARMMSFEERSVGEAKSVAEFDYSALAELFPTRGLRRRLVAKRFLYESADYPLTRRVAR